MKATTWGSAALAVLSLCGGGAWAAPVPGVVSPGSAEGASIADPCPTFTWVRIEGAVSYELVVYRVGHPGAEAEPVLSRELPGGSVVWTPPLDRCLEGGEPYAWSVRAATEKGLSAWAAPLIFEVAPRPSAEGLAALPAAASAGAAAARMTVVGEVRTLGPGGEPRLWGRGRHGVAVYPRPITPGIHFCSNGAGVSFGLSTASVDWGSAADACPAGTWVCREAEIIPCNTNRPDSPFDGILCDGSSIDFDEAAHYGWVEDHDSENVTFQSVSLSEEGDRSAARGCWTLPVWCCWE